MRIKFFLVLIVILSVTVLMTGCNTMNGFGKDLQSWTADEAHGHNMAQQQRDHQRHNAYSQSYQNTSYK